MNVWMKTEGRNGWKEGIWCVDDDANNDNDNKENNYCMEIPDLKGWQLDAFCHIP